jgi:hypothetical protein
MTHSAAATRTLRSPAVDPTGRRRGSAPVPCRRRRSQRTRHRDVHPVIDAVPRLDTRRGARTPEEPPPGHHRGRLHDRRGRAPARAIPASLRTDTARRTDVAQWRRTVTLVAGAIGHRHARAHRCAASRPAQFRFGCVSRGGDPVPREATGNRAGTRADATTDPENAAARGSSGELPRPLDDDPTRRHFGLLDDRRLGRHPGA